MNQRNRISLVTSLRIILGDQLTHDLSALDGLDPKRDIVLMMEVADETTYVRHHKQKIALILSAMRHFAKELAENGIQVDYIRLDAPKNTGSFTGEVKRAIARHKPDRIIVTEPGEWRVMEMMRSWSENLDRWKILAGQSRAKMLKKRSSILFKPACPLLAIIKMQ